MLGVLYWGVFGIFCQKHLNRGPLTPPQKFFLKKIIFFICFTIAQGFWNNFCFGVNIIFWPQKGSFSKNMDFGVILGDIHIIKMLKLQTNFPPGRNFSNVKISFPLHSRTPKTNNSLWPSHLDEKSSLNTPYCPTHLYFSPKKIFPHAICLTLSLL